MRRSVGWTLAGLASDGPWEELFHRAMLYGTTQTQIVPRVFTSEELARIEAPTLLVLGERERIYRPDKAARAARRLMPAVRVKLCTGTAARTRARRWVGALAHPGCLIFAAVAVMLGGTTGSARTSFGH